MTPVQFESNIEKLKKKNPTHDILYVLEERGYDMLSVEYLKLALAEDGEPEAVSKDRLYTQKSSLYSERAKWSNKFHDCTTDKERAEVSIAIRAIQTQIIDNRHAIEAYLTTGKLPAPARRLIMPFDGRRQAKKIHSSRTSISRFKKLIRTETDPEKIKEYEAGIDKHRKVIRELSA